MALSARRNALLAELAEVEAEELAQKTKGNVNSFSNYGHGNQSYAGPNTNSGAYSGNGNRHHVNNNHGNGPTIHNSGDFKGNGNGGFVRGDFDASTRNYRW